MQRSYKRLGQVSYVQIFQSSNIENGYLLNMGLTSNQEISKQIIPQRFIRNWESQTITETFWHIITYIKCTLSSSRNKDKKWSKSTSDYMMKHLRIYKILLHSACKFHFKEIVRQSFLILYFYIHILYECSIWLMCDLVWIWIMKGSVGLLVIFRLIF